MINSLCIIYTIILSIILSSEGELYKSISDVVSLLETQKSIIDHLEVYVTQEEQKLATLKRHLHTFKKEHQTATANVTNFLGSPINAFRLIKRLTVDIKDINHTIVNGKEGITTILSHFKTLDYPSEKDLKGAANALSRLQNKYQLDIKNLAEGKTNRDISTVPLTSSDCFIMGRVLYNETKYKQALSWFLIALEKLRADTYVDHVLETDIIEYIASYNFSNINT